MGAGGPERSLLYPAVMGEAMNRLAPPIREFHTAPAPVRYAGRASVERGSGPLVAIAAVFAGLPRSSPDCTVEIEVARDLDALETWQRRFDGIPFVTTQHAGTGSWHGLVVERVGPAAVAYAVVERHGSLHLDVRGWRLFGLPMPRFLAPRAVAFEHAADGRFNFDVEMSLPLLGRLVHYRGWLAPTPQVGSGIAKPDPV